MTIGGVPVTKPGALVSADAAIALQEPVARFVSRGGEKLHAALARLSVPVRGRLWLDAGASAGGFVDRLLQGGARGVAAVDVGYGQLDWRLRNDPRVVVLERTNARSLRRGDLPWPPEGVVADLSFISLTLVLPALSAVAAEDADFLLLVKPQFEVGREAVPRGGVVRDPRLWREAIEKVVGAAGALGLGLVGAVVAEPAGPAGNREFFVHLHRGVEGDHAAVDRALEEAG